MSRDSVQEFEASLREDMEHARFASYAVALDPVEPIGLYGKNKNFVALQLNPRDVRPVGDRAMVEAHLCTNYTKPDGEPVSKRFIDKNSWRFRGHVTIGEAEYENMTLEQIEKFRADPAGFLFGQAYERMDANARHYGEETELIVLPEDVGFAGLSVVCQRKQ